MKGNLGQIQGSLQSQPIEGLDIFKALLESQVAARDQTMN